MWDMCDWILRVPLSFSDANKDARWVVRGGGGGGGGGGGRGQGGLGREDAVARELCYTG